jgi:hypothetical protein
VSVRSWSLWACGVVEVAAAILFSWQPFGVYNGGISSRRGGFIWFNVSRASSALSVTLIRSWELGGLSFYKKDQRCCEEGIERTHWIPFACGFENVHAFKSWCPVFSELLRSEVPKVCHQFSIRTHSIVISKSQNSPKFPPTLSSWKRLTILTHQPQNCDVSFRCCSVIKFLQQLQIVIMPANRGLGHISLCRSIVKYVGADSFAAR